MAFIEQCPAILHPVGFALEQQHRLSQVEAGLGQDVARPALSLWEGVQL